VFLSNLTHGTLIGKHFLGLRHNAYFSPCFSYLVFSRNSIFLCSNRLLQLISHTFLLRYDYAFAIVRFQFLANLVVMQNNLCGVV